MKKFFLFLLMLLLTISGFGCASNNQKEVNKLPSKDNQLISSDVNNGVENYFKAMDSAMNSYSNLSNEFKNNYKNYSIEQLNNYKAKIDNELTNFGNARKQIDTYNKKLNDAHSKISTGLMDLKMAANNLIEKDNGGTEDKAVKCYNDSIDVMKDILQEQSSLKKNILNSAK